MTRRANRRRTRRKIKGSTVKITVHRAPPSADADAAIEEMWFHLLVAAIERARARGIEFGTESEATVVAPPAHDDVVPVWLNVRGAAHRAAVSQKVIYRAVRNGKLRAAKVGGRGTFRFRAEWVDQWLETIAPAGARE